MFLDNLKQDLRYAVRSCVKAPSFTLIILATLAFGITTPISDLGSADF